MNILAIESSDQTASVAIAQNNILLYEETLGNQRTHSETLMPMVDRALKTLSLGYDDVDVLAVNQGPGSFTGLRIGICTANALAMAWNKPMIAVSAFESLYGNVSEYNSLVSPLIDARNTQVYATAYWNNQQQCDYFAGDILTWLAKLEQINETINAESICFVGRGASAQETYIVDCLGKKAVFASMQNMTYRASTLAMIANKRIEHGDYSKEIMPLYVRKSQAEREHYGE